MLRIISENDEILSVSYLHVLFLQPNNIFLNRSKRRDGSYEYQVKIGDFGLARTDLFRADPPNGAEFTSMIEPLTPLFEG